MPMDICDPVSLRQCRVVRADGELDLSTMVAFAALLHGPDLAPKTLLLVVDLRPVSFMDSSGVHGLRSAQTRCKDRGGGTRLVYHQRGIHFLLWAMGLTEQFPRYATTLDARLGRITPAGSSSLGGSSFLRPVSGTDGLGARAWGRIEDCAKA